MGKSKKLQSTTDAGNADLADVKCRFFAQYWGTKTMYVGGVGLVEIGSGGWNLKHPDFFLQLKSLASISDGDAEKLVLTLGNVIGLDMLIRDKSNDLVRYVVANYSLGGCLFMLPSSFTDLARSLGYAIDWNNYNVPKQIEMGWVRVG